MNDELLEKIVKSKLVRKYGLNNDGYSFFLTNGTILYFNEKDNIIFNIRENTITNDGVNWLIDNLK